MEFKFELTSFVLGLVSAIVLLGLPQLAGMAAARIVFWYQARTQEPYMATQQDVRRALSGSLSRGNYLDTAASRIRSGS